MTGRLLAGRYELGAVLGRGGAAEVRDAWDVRGRRPVAIKLLHPVFIDRSDLRRRFSDEAIAVGSLSHPNIVAVYDYGETEGAPFLVMERLSGETLGDEMARGPMEPSRVRRVLDDVLSALDAAHAAGVLHRDIKPANILLSPTGAKVADFGIAKTSGSAPTTTGQLVGTLCYLSPQRVRGAPASVADDLYAVGLVGYEALLGVPAFAHDNPAALAHAITAGPLPPVAARRTGVDPVLAGVIDRALAPEPRQRFSGAGQMRAALAARRPATMVFDQPSPAAVGPKAEPTRTRRYAYAGAILLAFAIAAAALMTGPFSSEPEPEPISTSTSATPPPPPPPSTPTSSRTATLAPPAAGNGKAGNGKPGRGNGNGNGNGKPK